MAVVMVSRNYEMHTIREVCLHFQHYS